MKIIMFRKILRATVFFLPMAIHSLSENCGKEGGSKNRIIGGSFPKPSHHPWMVSFYRYGKGKQYFCGGSLISDRLVLTAKHCTVGMDHWSKAKVGIHSFTDSTDYQSVEIRKVILHNTINLNDVAILLLETPVNLRDPTIGTICIPHSENKEFTGENVKAIGWGMKGLQKSDFFFNIVNLEVDKKQEKYWLYTKIKHINGVYQHSCVGDSGGPLLHKKDDRWTIIAIGIGKGYDCLSRNIKGLGKWNKITDHLKWIKRVMKKYKGDGNDYGKREEVYNVIDQNGDTYEEIIKKLKDLLKKNRKALLEEDSAFFHKIFQAEEKKDTDYLEKVSTFKETLTKIMAEEYLNYTEKLLEIINSNKDGLKKLIEIHETADDKTMKKLTKKMNSLQTEFNIFIKHAKEMMLNKVTAGNNISGNPNRETTAFMERLIKPVYEIQAFMEVMKKYLNKRRELVKNS